MASKEVRAKLRKPFPADQVKQRQGPRGIKLDYVAGEDFINRLVEVTQDEDIGWAWQSSVAHVERIEKKNDEGESYFVWAVVVHGQLQILGDVGGGVGAMENADLDMAAKSANTEALKNACKNGFAMGLELWDAEYRATLGQQRRLLEGSEQAMKQAVWKLAQERDPQAKTGPKVAKLFGVTADELKDADVLKGILVKEGVLDE